MSGQDLHDIPGVGPERAKRIQRAYGVRTIRDLLFVFPRTYLDRTRIVPIGGLAAGTQVVVSGAVERVTFFRARLPVVTAHVRDDSAKIRAVWFGQPFMRRALKEGDRLLLAGDVVDSRGLHLRVRDYEAIRDDEPVHFGKLVPIYPSAEGVPRKVLRRIVHEALKTCDMPETLPDEMRARRDLLPLAEALRSIHFPADPEAFRLARRRMAFDELFLLQLALSMSRAARERVRIDRPMKMWPALDLRIRSLLPFPLTGAQKRVVSEIVGDVTSNRPMNRLLQGDVGSGKTVVALIAALVAIGNRRQVALMAPTEVLARQHARSISKILGNARVNVALLTGGVSKERRHLLRSAAGGELDLLIGTHALLEPDVKFKNLGLAIIDEQHKFGVNQRAALLAKGRSVHALVMTATPIPRTLTIAAYGDLDVSVIDELPPGRRPPRTYVRPPDRLPQVLQFIRQKLKEGRQAFFVYPIIEESERLAQVRSATEMFAKVRGELDGSRVELLHGRMKDEEKEATMAAFRSGKVHVLVSTVVIEVGVDVPNATVMVVGNAERFGLSQLHQLRGRIGRGAHDSTCILLARPGTEEARRRLKTLASTTDGFKIAEADLEIRGPGDYLGTRQSGLPEFRIASLPADSDVLDLARTEAQSLVRKDPALTALQGSALLEGLRTLYGRGVSQTRGG